MIDGYYLDEKSKMYKKCETSCKTCSSTPNCLECKNAEGYYHLNDENISKRIKIYFKL